jgi:hypothetical protein
MRCSQVGQDVLRQDAAVLRYAPRGIRTMRAQQSAPFSRMAHDVLAPLQLIVEGGKAGVVFLDYENLPTDFARLLMIILLRYHRLPKGALIPHYS